MDGVMDVKTAGRTVELFEIFARARAPLTLSELARALNAPQSSCFNLLRALEARGYLYSVGGNKRVYPTRKLFDLAEAIAGYDPVIPRVEATLAALRDRTHETVILGTRQGEQVIYLAVAEGRQTIRYISRAGELKPMHASAIGKALLMAMPEAERERLVYRLPLAAATARTVTDSERLLADIAAAAARGYAQTEGENVADVMAVACPLRVEAISYAIAVAGPVGRMAPRAGEVAGWVRDAIGALE
jgi:DNA-binding IclR family transcriptional regulator